MTTAPASQGPRQRTARRMAPVFAVLARIDLTAALRALAVIAAITLLSIETPVAVNGHGVPVVVAFGIAAVHVASLPVAVTRPMAANLLAMAAALALQLIGTSTGIWPWWPVLIVTQSLVLFLVGLRSSWPAGVAAWLVTVLPASVAAMALGRGNSDVVSANLIVFISISAAAVTLGLFVAQWRLLTDQLLTERRVGAEVLSRRILAEDRARIARELHDVVAHSMSIINVQASTARYRIPELDDQAVREFEEIAASSRQALGEMRGLLGVLRADDVAGELTPQPGLTDIPDVVAQAERAGMRVTLRMAPPGDVADVTEVVGLTAYRVVQEALTNAFRYAAGSAVSVSCQREGDTLVLTVRNEAPSLLRTVRAGSGSGLGLVGMAERVGSVGGTVETGVTSDGGFSVRAILPVRGDGTGGGR